MQSDVMQQTRPAKGHDLRGRPAAAAARAARSATPRECPDRDGDRRSVKSATASGAS